MTGVNIDRGQNWQASRITKKYCHRWTQHLWFVQSIKFHQIEVLATLVLKRWQVPILRSVKFDSRQESQKAIVTIEFATLDLFIVQNFFKIEVFAVRGPYLWPKNWQVPTLTGVKNYKKFLSPLGSGFSIYVEFQISSKLKFSCNFCSKLWPKR